MKILRSLSVAVFTVTIYLGIPILGWCFPDFQFSLASFFASPTYLAYSLVVIMFGLFIGIQSYHSMEGIQDGKGLAETRVNRQTVIGIVLVVTLFVAMFILPLTSRRAIGVFSATPFLQWFGVLLCVLGYMLIFWSGLVLGRQYSVEVVLQQDHQLITSGPYRLIRHPRYLGILCLSFGVSLLFHSWLGLAFSIPVIGLILSRIHDEEHLLQNAFGKAWQKYCQRSWRLLPYLY